MPNIAVESTLLAAVAYDASHRTLEIQFHDRGTYHYFGVPAEIHDALLCAPSKGQYFNRTIRGKFQYALRPQQGKGAFLS